jgi:hypothetical protein
LGEHATAKLPVAGIQCDERPGIGSVSPEEQGILPRVVSCSGSAFGICLPNLVARRPPPRARRRKGQLGLGWSKQRVCQASDKYWLLPCDQAGTGLFRLPANGINRSGGSGGAPRFGRTLPNNALTRFFISRIATSLLPLW